MHGRSHSDLCLDGWLGLARPSMASDRDGVGSLAAENYGDEGSSSCAQEQFSTPDSSIDDSVRTARASERRLDLGCRRADLQTTLARARQSQTPTNTNARGVVGGTSVGIVGVGVGVGGLGPKWVLHH